MNMMGVKGLGGALNLDKSYNFVEKKPVIDEIRHLFDVNHLKDAAAESGVSKSTLWSWFNGKTISPRTQTVNRALAPYGKRLGIVDLEP